jgi:hypothetical protein
VLNLCLSTLPKLYAASDRVKMPGKLLPARFHDTGNISPERQRAEAQAAYAELAQEGAGPSAQLAAIVLAALELGLTSVLDSFCSSCHFASIP